MGIVEIGPAVVNTNSRAHCSGNKHIRTRLSISRTMDKKMRVQPFNYAVKILS